MLPHPRINPLNPQLSKIPLFNFAIAVTVLQTLLHATNGSAEGAVGATAVSFGHFDDSLVFLGGKVSFLGAVAVAVAVAVVYCGGGGGEECGVVRVV
jgi:hypothetical protein